MIYVVNKQTKEHVKPDRNKYYPDYLWDYLNADPDGWIEWHGGECPLPDDQLCEVKLSYSQQIAKSGAIPSIRWTWPWTKRGLSWDIIAYRPILDDKPQASKDCCVTVRYDLDPVSVVESALRDKLIAMGWTPPKSDREKWVEAALDTYADKPGSMEERFGRIYDAIKSNKLPSPSKE